MQDDSIECLGLPIRIINRCIAEGIYTVSQLLGKKYWEICRIPGISTKSLREIEEAIFKYNKNKYPNTSDQIEFDKDELKNVVSAALTKQMYNYFDITGKYIIRKEIADCLKAMQNEINCKLLLEVNEMRTIVLEQSRILESLQFMNNSNGVLEKISEKIPGFKESIYDLFRTINATAV